MLGTTGVKDPHGSHVSKMARKIFPVRDVETLRLLWICCDRGSAWAYDPDSRKWLAKDLVVYRNLLADELPWARSFGEFSDGRFIPIQPNQIDEPTIAMELFG